MTDLEKALAAGGKPVMSDLDRALAAGGVASDEHDETPEEANLRESFLNKDKFQPSPGHRPLKNTGPDAVGQLRAESDELQQRANPENIGGPLNSMVDRYTLGAYGGALRGLSSLGEAANRAFGSDKESVFRAPLRGMENYREFAHPITQALTDAPAYAAEGPLTALAGGLGRAAETAFRGPVLRTLATSLGTSGIASASHAASEGGGPADIARAGIEGGAIGGAVGGGLAAAARGAQGLGRMVTESRGGKARQLIEKHGGTVSPGGVELQGDYVTKGTSDADIGAQAEASANKGLGMLRTEERAVKGAAGRQIGRVGESPAAGELVDVTDVMANMRAAAEDLGTDTGTAQKLHDAIGKIERQQGADFNPDTDNYFLTQNDANKLRRSLGRSGKSGISTDEKLNPLQRATSQVKDIVDQGPFAEANAEFAKEAKNYQQSRKLLGIAERPKTPDESQAAISKVKNLITRRGQNTVTAGGQEGRLAEFEAKHPDIAQEFIKPELLRSKADISFHVLPQHGGLIQRGIGAALLHGLPQVAAGFTHSPGATAATLAGTLALQNAPAIAARFLYGPALSAQNIAPLLLEAPILGAAAEERRR